MNILETHRPAIESACAQFGVRELYAFGSVLTKKFNPSSDIDFIVSLIAEDPIEYAENYFELKAALEAIFQREIDLLEQKSVRNRHFAEVLEKQKKLVYAGRYKNLA